jgi:hypothetical protein
MCKRADSFTIRNVELETKDGKQIHIAEKNSDLKRRSMPRSPKKKTERGALRVGSMSQGPGEWVGQLAMYISLNNHPLGPA